MTEPVTRLLMSSPADVTAERNQAAMIAGRLDGGFAGRVEAAACEAAEARRRHAAAGQGNRVRDAEALAAASRRPPQRTTVCLMATLLLAGLDVRHGWAAGVHGDQPSANSLDFHPPQKFHATRSVPLSGVNDSLDRLRRLQARLLSQVSPSAGSLQSQAVALSELSSILLSQGQTQVALDAATQAQQIFRSFLKDQPDSTTHQRYLAVSLVTVGDAQGNLPEVLKSYQRSLAILDRLAKSDPGNAVWQRDLASGYARLGACFEQVADLADARNAFSEGRLIIIHLLTRFPDHPQWTRDLANFDSAILALGEPVPQSRSRN